MWIQFSVAARTADVNITNVRRGEPAMMSTSRFPWGLSVTLTIIAAVLLAATPYALADGQVVIFSQDTGSLSSVSYTVDVTGTFSHLVMDLEAGVYDVQQDGVSLGTYNCYEGDNWVEFTSSGDGTFTFTLALAGAPPAPVITTNGGSDYTTTEPSLLLEGTCDSAIETIEVNGSTSGVSYAAGDTAWSYTDTLSAGANVFQVTATADGLTSLPDTITITLAGAEPPPAPVITTNGGSDYTTTEPSLLLEGTCDTSTETIEVNGSTSGVSYTAGETAWSYTDTLSAGTNVFQVTATADGLTSLPDTITITLAGPEPPPAPVITTNGGSNYTTTEPSLLIEGTCDSSLVMVEVNGSTAGVSYTAGQTAWSYNGTLVEGDNVFDVTGTNNDALTSPADSITVTLDTTPPPVPIITSDGGSGPGADFTTDNPSFALAGTCDSSTDTIRVNGSSSGVAYVPGGTSWTFGEEAVETEMAPVVAVAFQNEGTLEAPALPAVSDLDDIWSPADVVPTGTVTSDSYASGTATGYLDALSLEFPAGSMDLSDLTLRVYLRKGTYYNNPWEHYDLLAGTFNPEDEDTYSFVYQPADSRDHLPDGELATGTTVGWIEFPFDAVSDPDYIEDNGNIGVTLRLWNWQVDAVRLAGFSPGGPVSLNEGANTFSVTAADAIGNESAADSITVTLATGGLAAPVITTDGGSGAGEDYLTNVPTLTLEGTCDTSTASILVNGSGTGVTYTAGTTTWTYAGTLIEGENTFAVAAQNSLGDMSAADSVTITLDTEAPPSIRPDIQP